MSKDIIITEDMKAEYLKVINLSFDLMTPYSFTKINDDGTKYSFLCRPESADLIKVLDSFIDRKLVRHSVWVASFDKEGKVRYGKFAFYIDWYDLCEVTHSVHNNESVPSFEDAILDEYNRLQNNRKFDDFYDDKCKLDGLGHLGKSHLNQIATAFSKLIFHGGSVLFNDYKIECDNFKNLLSGLAEFEYGFPTCFNSGRLFIECSVSNEFLLKKKSHIEKANDHIQNFPVDWKFFNDFNRMVPKDDKGYLNNGYSWIENGKKSITKKDGTVATVNPRKDFFYAYPLLSVMFRENRFDDGLDSVIDANRDVFNNIARHLHRHSDAMSVCDIGIIKNALKVLNRKLVGSISSSIHKLDDEQKSNQEVINFIRNAVNLPDNIGDHVRIRNTEVFLDLSYETGIDHKYCSELYRDDILMFFGQIPEKIRNEIINLPAKTDIKCLTVIMALMSEVLNDIDVPFASSVGVKLIRNTFKDSLLKSLSENLYPCQKDLVDKIISVLDDKQEIEMVNVSSSTDFTYLNDGIKNFKNDVAPLFEKRVLFPMALHVMRYDYVDGNDLALPISYESLKYHIGHSSSVSFFVDSCGMSIGDMFRLNEVVHENMVEFSESGKDLKAVSWLNIESTKKIEGDKCHLFTQIRSDRFRNELGMSYNIDWFPLFDYSYLAEGYASGEEYRFVPLLSQADLKTESDVMRHCVGHFGYDSRCLQGSSRIFTIIDQKKIRRGTLELSIDNNQVRVRQLYDFRNREVSMEIRDLAQNMVSKINNGDINVNWDRLNEITPSGEFVFKNNKISNGDIREQMIEDACGYDFRNLTSIRAAANPWRDFLPKNLKSMNPRAYAHEPAIKNIIFAAKEIIGSQVD